MTVVYHRDLKVRPHSDVTLRVHDLGSDNTVVEPVSSVLGLVLAQMCGIEDGHAIVTPVFDNEEIVIGFDVSFLADPITDEPTLDM